MARVRCLRGSSGAARRYWRRARLVVPLAGLLAVMMAGPASPGNWRVGDRDQPWLLAPVSFRMDRGWQYKPDFYLGGSWACELVVDDDGDGQIDEDGVDLVDNDGDFLWNEDPPDGVDNDGDGLIDEDGPDPQFDNDGDGLINEDGRVTGDQIFDPNMRAVVEGAPFYRYRTQADAEADAQGWGSGYGWGDDDRDGRFNEDKLDGLDNDGDGLIDEDATQPTYVLPASWDRWVFAYDTALLSAAQRQTTPWLLRPDGQQYYAVTIAAGDTTPVVLTGGDTLVADRVRRTFAPTDFVRPARMDSTRSLFHFVHDQYLAGQYSQSPFDAQSYGATQPTIYETTSGYGQIVDGNIHTARIQDQANASAGFRGELRGKYLVNRIRYRPRPSFADRSLHSFYVMYANDTPSHYRETYADGEYNKNMVVSAWLFDQVREWYSPAVKDIQLNGGRFGSPKESRIIDIRGLMAGGVSWEFAEVELFAAGYAMDAYYVTEVIDVGTSKPQYRRYFEPADPTRRTLIEKVTTVDVNKNGTIDPTETTRSILNKQFNMDAAGTPVTWGRVRWSGQREGAGSNIQIRMRAGTTPDPYVYVRRIGKGVYSQYVESAIALDWPRRGETIDAFIYATMSATERANGSALPYNSMGDTDGAAGGWSFWSVPFNFEDGLVDQNGEGGVVMPLPPLTRYVQFQVDFTVPTSASSGIALDWLDFEFFDPYVRGGILAEVFTDSLTTDGAGVPVVLGDPFPFKYVMKPGFESRQDPGFNRIDLAVPTLTAQLEEFRVDGLAWTRYEPEVPTGLTAAAAAAYRDSLAHSKEWLGQLAVTRPRTFALATYADPRTKGYTLSIKTPKLGYDQFPSGQGRDIELRLRTPLYRLLTDFSSWVRDDALDDAIVQATTAGNASDQLPMDQTSVTAQQAGKPLEVESATPNPFSPNGDGINDQIDFRVRLFLLTEDVAVRVDIFDLAGRRVRRLGPERMSAGSLALSWDGRDEAGSVVPPGVYAYVLVVDSDTDESKVRTGTVGVAY
jgi:hypothetical protein